MVSGEVVCVVVVLVVAGAERKECTIPLRKCERLEVSQFGLSLNILIYKSHEHKFSLVVVVVSSVLEVVEALEEVVVVTVEAVDTRRS